MKKILFLLSFSIILSQNLFSQNSYKVKTKTGKVFGVNTASLSPTISLASTAPSCGKVTGVTDSVASWGGITVLTTSFVPNGGSYVALSLNGVWYKDGQTGYGLWSGGSDKINAICSYISGGITAGKTFNVIVRTYCNSDTTASPYYDSEVNVYVVPSAGATYPCGTSNNCPTAPKKCPKNQHYAGFPTCGCVKD